MVSMPNPEQPSDLYARRDLPVLRVVTREIDAGRAGLSSQAVAQELGKDELDVYNAAGALQRHGLVDARLHFAKRSATFHDVHPPAYFEAGLYVRAETRAEQLLSALLQAAETAPEPAQRGRLRKAAEELKGVPTEVVSAVVAALISAAVTGQF